jgi:hypothetical protein
LKDATQCKYRAQREEMKIFGAMNKSGEAATSNECPSVIVPNCNGSGAIKPSLWHETDEVLVVLLVLTAYLNILPSVISKR